jgi:hypothetical protein
MTQNFRELQKVWYQRLKDEGFVDIEETPDLANASKKNIKYLSTNREAIEGYQARADQFLHDYEFKNKFEHGVWELVTEGYSVRSIAVIISSAGTEVSKSTVGRTIARLRDIMLKAYL